jgi:hypothetical protein
MILRRGNEVAVFGGAGPQGQESLVWLAAVPVQAFPQPGIGLDREAGDRCDAAGCFSCASHGAGVQGMHPAAVQPPAGTAGLLAADRRQPGITRHGLFLPVLHQVGQRHADHPARPEGMFTSRSGPVSRQCALMPRTGRAPRARDGDLAV